MTTPNQIQIAFTTRHGKRKALYRSKMVNGSWMPHWHHITVADAEKAVSRNSTAGIITGADSTVEVYQKAA